LCAELSSWSSSSQSARGVIGRKSQLWVKRLWLSGTLGQITWILDGPRDHPHTPGRSRPRTRQGPFRLSQFLPAIEEARSLEGPMRVVVFLKRQPVFSDIPCYEGRRVMSTKLAPGGWGGGGGGGGGGCIDLDYCSRDLRRGAETVAYGFGGLRCQRGEYRHGISV
jgi:hypothetical protein